MGGDGGCLAVDVVTEEFEDFGAALGAPLFGGGDGGAILHEQGVRQGVMGHVGFVVVGVGGVGWGEKGKAEAEEQWQAGHVRMKSWSAGCVKFCGGGGPWGFARFRVKAVTRSRANQAVILSSVCGMSE
ncbi:MAG: hypothetical protein RI897_1792 [Verrucomicrobiota bacterium]